MKYAIRLTITHSYAQPAANCRHLIRVVPAHITGRQHLLSQRLDILPEPDMRMQGVDFFGTSKTTCTHSEPHSRMSIQLASHVEMQSLPHWRDLSPSVRQVRSEWQASADLGPASPLHFIGPAPRLSPDEAIAGFARSVFDPKLSAAANVIALGQALHDEMTFDAAATTVETEAQQAFALRRGVCQDFSHIMIVALQSLGIPAGYVSGYLRTLPPEGHARLEGADAMHAWVRAWCGNAQGWIEYDPTNAAQPRADHIVVGYGRDYSDAAPVSGHLRSSGGQTNGQSVDVAVLD